MNNEQFNAESFIDGDNVVRWKSNNAVPFDDMLEEQGLTAAQRAVCKAARDRDTGAFIAEYILSQKSRSAEQIAEERFEARASLGAGVAMVNAITGERWTS